MSSEQEISVEMLMAFADGELDGADWDRVAVRLRADPALRAQLCDVRATKDLVRGAYAALPAPSRRIVVGRRARWAAVAALCLASVAAGWFGRAVLAPESGQPELLVKAAAGDRIVVHVTTSQREALATALDEVEDALRVALKDERRLQVEIVANGTGLDLLRAGASPFAARLAQLRARYPALTLVACNQTIGRVREQGVAVQLLPGVAVAPSALDQVVRRLQGGWVYVRA